MRALIEHLEQKFQENQQKLDTTLITSSFTPLAERLPMRDFMALCVDRKTRERFEEQRQLLVSRHVHEKFQFDMMLLAGLEMRQPLDECLDVNKLEELKTLDNPLLHMLIWQSFAGFTRFPTQKAPELIPVVRDYAKQWKKIAMRQNGLFAYFLNFMQKCGAINASLRQYGESADEMMRGLIALSIIYDLHKPSNEKMLKRQLKKVKDDTLEGKTVAPFEDLVFANTKPSDDKIGLMMAQLFTLDDQHDLQMNKLYLNALITLVQQNVGLEHMRKVHNASCGFDYQHSIFSKTIDELRENGILSEDEEKSVRSQHFISKLW